MRGESNRQRPPAVIVGVQLPDVSDAEHAASPAELARLAETLGLDVVGRLTQRRKQLAHGAVVGEGKLKELADWTKVPVDDEGDPLPDVPPPRAKVVLIDHDVTPSQARNLEKATEAEVLDRSAVILAIFQRHARTREARLQVEIGRLKYMAPRTREAAGGKDRQRGGIGGKGAGESAVELDRRRIRDRIAELTQELAAIEHE